jgi:hypothetical protein
MNCMFRVALQLRDSGKKDKIEWFKPLFLYKTRKKMA